MDYVGFIGTGIMGKPMAKNLIKGGYALAVYDIDPNPIEELRNEGAEICKSIKEVTEKAKIIITMLPNSPESEEVIIGDAGIVKYAKRNTLVIDMSSIDPMVSIKIGKKLAVSGIKFLDAPVSGGEPKAIDGTLAIMVGGTEENFKEAEPLFRTLGNSHTLVGDIGAGNFTKLSNQIIVAINIAAVSEALLLAKKAGLSPTKVFNAIRGGLAGSTVLDSKAPMMIERNFKPGFKIKLHLKDMQNAINAGSSLEMPLPISSQLLEILKSLIVLEKGEMDHSAILNYFEKISNIKVSE